MKKLNTFDEFVNEAKTETYPKEVQKILNDLVSKIGLKKYQLSVGDAYGVYMIDLPTTGLTKSMMISLIGIMPDGSSIGAFSAHGNGLVLRTNIPITAQK
jgi:hypothetical protein